jgi:L,D-peptidoglycan transpeptidase YkuD (ErfK/YbiS/YcfS/YnhG family)
LAGCQGLGKSVSITGAWRAARRDLEREPASLYNAGVDVRVSPQGRLAVGERTCRCALGRGGVRADKREGDGATPAGIVPFRRVLYRADRLSRPATRLPVDRLREEDGWCDAPEDSRYNQQVRLPYGARHERLWRQDHLYDVLVVLGYNDAPVIPGRGSAVFLHVAQPDFVPTEGCVALALSDLLALLEALGPDDRLVIAAASA